jgi:hypothetical protein
MIDPTIERTLRLQATYQVKSVWGLSEDEVGARVDIIMGSIQHSRAKDRLNDSHRLLVRTIEQIAFDEDYEKVEDPQTFKELLWALKDVFEALFDSNIIEESVDFRPDNIIGLSMDFYRRMNQTLGLIDRRDQLPCGYPGIATLIVMLRNCTEHDSKPRDHITGKYSYGNLHTLVAIAVLSIYAYHEILGVWCDIINHEQEGQ